jgi:RNA polymerase sigma-70 factor (ECF subfamily)
LRRTRPESRLDRSQIRIARLDRTRLESLTDGALARRAADGEAAAIDVLLRRHHELVYRVCRRLCLSDADALDATQEALIRVARGIGRYDGRSAFTTWLYRVVTNACLDELRRQRRRPLTVPIHSDGLDTTGHIDGDARRRRGGSVSAPAPDANDATVDRLTLDQALRDLLPDFRAAVVLRDVVGLDYAAIAEVLDIPAGTVRSRIARGRAHLARALTSGPQEGNLAGNRDRPAERRTSQAARSARATGTSHPASDPASDPLP